MRNTVTIKLPDKMVADLYKVAKNTGKSKSELIKEALRAYLWEERFKTVRSAITTKAKVKKLVKDEDAFKIIS